MESLTELVREFSVGRYDGKALISSLTLQEAKNVAADIQNIAPQDYRRGLYYIEGPMGRERVRDAEAPVIASVITGNAKDYLLDRAKNGYATVDGTHVEELARGLGDAIYILQAAESLAHHEESFNRVVESFRQG